MDYDWSMLGRLLCRMGHHKWNLAFRRVGEHQPCERPGCNAVALALSTDEEWREEGWRIVERAQGPS